MGGLVGYNVPALQHRSHEIAMLLGETAPDRSHGHVAPGNGHTVGSTKKDRRLGVVEPDVKRSSRDAEAVLPHARTPSSLTGPRAIYQGTIYQCTARRTASIVRSSPKVLRRCRPSSKGEAKSFLHSWTVPLRRPEAPPLRVLRSEDWASGGTLRRLPLGVWAVAGRGGGRGGGARGGWFAGGEAGGVCSTRTSVRSRLSCACCFAEARTRASVPRVAAPSPGSASRTRSGGGGGMVAAAGSRSRRRTWSC